MSSCGKNVTVNLAETALLWRVDDYFDIDHNQRAQIKANFRSALKEANDETVPELEIRIFSEALQSQSCEQIKKDYASLKPKIESAWIKLLRHGYSFIDSVSKKQIEYFIDQVQDDLKDEASELKSTIANSKLEKRIKRTINVWEELLGSLTNIQTEQIKDYMNRSKNIDHLFYESRQKNLAVVKSKSESEVKAYVKTYLIDWEEQQTPELKKAFNERRTNNESFSLEFFCAATIEQKKHFQNTVRDYLDLTRKVYINPPSKETLSPESALIQKAQSN